MIKIPGDPKTILAFSRNSRELVIKHINSSNLGPGGGRALAIEGLRIANVNSLGREIRFQNVINPPTIQAVSAGAPIVSTPIAKLGGYIAKSYGRVVTGARVERTRGDQIDIVLELN